MAIENFDVIVLGVGGMGSATLHTLAKRGLRVCGVEQFGVAHDRGSSHGHTRIIRKAYFEHPDYMPLLNRAYALWAKLQAQTGEQLQMNTGLLLAGAADSPTILGLEKCYAEHQQPHQRMGAAEACRKFPQFALDKKMEVFYDPTAGFLFVEKCVELHIRLALESGAMLYKHERVLSWEAHEDAILVQTEHRKLRAAKLVITMGAWVTTELRRLGFSLEVWRKVVLWYDSPNIQNYRRDRFPIFYVETAYGDFYGFPAIDALGIKVAEHARPHVIDAPEQLQRDLQSGDESDVLKFLHAHLPDFRPRRTGHSVCMYTMTPDQNFILDLHPDHENVVIGAGFSGHGFKFAPVVGEVLSDLALTGQSPLAIDFLRLDRFQQIL